MNCDISPKAKLLSLLVIGSFIAGIFVGSSQVKTNAQCKEIVKNDDRVEEMLELPSE